MKIISSGSNYELHYQEEEGITMMKFIGDMSDEEYKDFWNLSINFGKANKINRVIINQQNIGNVSFKARAWVVMNAVPKVKREMPKDLSACIISSEKIMQKTGMQYLLKAFITFTGYNVELQPTIETAVAYLKSKN